MEYFEFCGVPGESVVQFRDNQVSFQDSRESVPDLYSGCGGAHLPGLQVDGVRLVTVNPGVVHQGCSGNAYVSFVTDEVMALLF